MVYWRHAVSENLTHWTDEGTALVPDSRYDSHGCYSGSGIKVPGGFEFFYTGNVKDEKGNRETYQILATAGEDAKPTRQLPPLISGPAKGYTAHYRDPHVFERNGEWWMVIGAQREDKTAPWSCTPPLTAASGPSAASWTSRIRASRAPTCMNAPRCCACAMS